MADVCERCQAIVGGEGGMRIGVLCSGGDAPGMNACVRAVVRSAFARGHQVVGIRRGYRGLVEGSFYPGEDGGIDLTPRSVSDWGRHGGTFLHSSRCPEFREPEGRERAAAVMKEHGIEALVVIEAMVRFVGPRRSPSIFRGRSSAVRARSTTICWGPILRSDFRRRCARRPKPSICCVIPPKATNGCFSLK